MMSMIKTLGYFECTELIGKGGMGEVYRAKDQKLGRDVAIKVLPEEFAKDADRVARFQREAKLLASLNHPNIASIHGLEESGGTHFLVLELIEGDTLADRIKRGPIPVEESLKLALQIAEALEAAHEKGVIHRDLKPANIKVTPDGRVKVLDFGLAKAFTGSHPDLDLSNSPTLSNPATMQGVILGTAAYMSPEQARGETVDARADIWAFGCVLFEMLAGRAAFEGRTVTDVLASVIKVEPEWRRLPPNLHPRILLLLERCLDKEAKNRYSGIGDARVDVQKALADSSGVFQPRGGARPPTKLRTLLLWSTLTILLIALAGIVIWNLKTTPAPEPRQVSRLYYELPKDQQFDNLFERVLAVSPDGRQLVYASSGPLYLRRMDELNAKSLPGTEGAQKPFFSPDGKWVGYVSAANNQLKKIAVSGGPPVTLADVDSLGLFNWGADDTIVYGQTGRGVMRVSANTGTPEEMIKAEESEYLIHPQILPDGESVLFTRVTPGQYKITVQSLKSGKRKELFSGDAAQYLPTGHLVYASGNDLFAIAFDLGALEVEGGPITMVQGVFRGGGAAQYAVSDSGTLAYIPTELGVAAGARRALVWVDRKGKEEPLSVPPDDYRYPRISPDGTRVVLAFQEAGNRNIWIWDLVRETLTRVTSDAASDSYPIWSLDGKRIAFFSTRNGKVGVYWKAADGTGEDESLGSVAGLAITPWSWSADGKSLVLMESTGGLNYDIGILSMEGDHKRKPLVREKHTDGQPQISRDGRWMAYMSTETGKPEVYVRPFPDVNGGKWQVSTSGGDSPLWSPDGSELFYRSGDSVIAVPVQTEPVFKPGKPETLFKGAYVSASLQDAHTWDISPDGRRFLMMKATEAVASADEGPRRINIVLNWTEELKRRVPVK